MEEVSQTSQVGIDLNCTHENEAKIATNAVLSKLGANSKVFLADVY